MFYSLKRGIRNLIRWFPIIWSDADLDWEYLATIMEKKLRWMSAGFQKYSRHTGAKKDARNMLVCAELIKRLRDDNFEEVTIWQHEIRIKEWQQMLGRLLGKHLRSWWD